VVQEFVLARDVQMIIGNTVIPLHLFDAAVNAIHDARGHMDQWERTDYAQQESRANASLMSQLFSYRKRYALSRKQPCSQNDKTIGVSLASYLVDSLQGRQCEDARDRVYAMLALTEDNFDIRPDYTVPLPTLLCDFAKQSLLSGDLAILCGSGLRPDHNSRLVSFAPSVEDWSGMPIPLDVHKLGFFASPNYPVRVGRTSHGNVSIAGVQIDHVFRVADFNFLGLHSLQEVQPVETMSYQEQQFHSWYMNTETKHVSHAESWPDRASELRGTLPFPCCYTAVSSGVSTFHRLLDLDQGSERHTLAPWYSRMASHKSRVIFDTRAGFLGLGPHWMQPDDCVVIFDGGKTPFILRKHPGSDDGHGLMWKLVGQCFLLDWMDGNYFGHTVVDEMPKSETGPEENAGAKEKFLVRESFVMC
jgi:hypothetical protein